MTRTDQQPKTGTHHRRFSPADLPKHLLMIAISAAAIYPLYYILTNSLKSSEEYLNNKFGLPMNPTIGNYVRIFSESNFAIWIVNSVVVVIGAVALSGLLAILAAWGLARYHFRGRMLTNHLVVSMMVIPSIVIILPLYIGLNAVGLLGTLPGVILVFTGMIMPTAIYMLTSFFKSVPQELVDAARVDGCSTLGVIARLVVPLSTPALITISVVNGVFVWNDLLIPLVFLQKQDRLTLMAGLTMFQGRFVSEEEMVMTGAFIGAVPMLLVYIFGQKYFTRGLMAGAVK